MKELGKNTHHVSNIKNQDYNVLAVRQNTGFSSSSFNNIFYSWKFKIVNGNFQIETGIRNISDLLPFNSSISYLSPFSDDGSSCSHDSASSRNSNNNIDVEEMYRGGQCLMIGFGSDENNNVIPLGLRILASCGKNSNTNYPKQFLLPSELVSYPNYIINRLLHTYFTCHNVYYPLVHENSFRSNLAKTKEPLTDLVTLSICCYVCSVPCEHSARFSSQKRRNMADFFYNKAKSIVLEQFDDPEKRTENVVSINLLGKYLQMTLKFSEARRLISMAYEICLDLRHDYNQHSVAPLSDCFGPSKHTHNEYATKDINDPPEYSKDLKPIKDVNKLLYSRHATTTICLRMVVNYVTNDPGNDECYHFPRWEYMEDEPAQTKQLAKAQNWIIDLFSHPFISNFMVNNGSYFSFFIIIDNFTRDKPIDYT